MQFGSDAHAHRIRIRFPFYGITKLVSYDCLQYGMHSPPSDNVQSFERCGIYILVLEHPLQMYNLLFNDSSSIMNRICLEFNVVFYSHFYVVVRHEILAN